MILADNHAKGFFLISRSIFDSIIWDKPSEHIKVWIFLIGRANHAPARYRGYSVERGQFFGTYREIAEQLSYHRGWARESVSESKLKHIMNGLKNMEMITVKKEPAGVLITILNYDLYQTAGNYERTSKATSTDTKSEPVSNQKKLTNNKKEKKEKNKNYSMNPEIKAEIINFISKSKQGSSEGYLWKMIEANGADAVTKAWKRKHCSGVYSPSTLWKASEYFRKEIDTRHKDELPDF
jgi:hypothetical protein